MATFKQEMPPQGGYAPITYQKVPLKKGLSPLLKLGILVGLQAAGFYVYSIFKKTANFESVEMRCAKIALQPMILAETDRRTLKHFKENQKMEAELMKDVKGWEVGKYLNRRVYNTIGEDEFFRPHPAELFAHSERNSYKSVVNIFSGA